jgi:hypothetical protein
MGLFTQPRTAINRHQPPSRRLMAVDGGIHQITNNKQQITE